MKIDYVDLRKQWQSERVELLKVIDQVLSSGQYVGGSEIKKFEKQICKITNKNYCVALNSGTDALTLGLHVLGVKRGDEVITAPNSFVATVAAIVHLGAKPVFVDVKPDQNIDIDLIEAAITKKTKVILPVHLTGRMCEMNRIVSLAKRYGLKVIEDAAQSIGSKYNGKSAGFYGDVSAFSAHPLKNLNALGDGGYLVTNNKSYYKKISLLRNHGMVNRKKISSFGYVSRMDNLQAAILNFRLSKLKEIISKRRENAKLYTKLIKTKKVFIPKEKKLEFNTYHTFVIQVEKRDSLIKYLLKNNIGSLIHYPTPIHLLNPCKKFGYKKGDFKNTEYQRTRIISLPIHQHLKKKEITYICKYINKFYEK